jgi:hypothetical protein
MFIHGRILLQSVTPPLFGDNYHEWALEMCRALATKNKFKFVDGSIEIWKEGDLNFYGVGEM